MSRPTQPLSLGALLPIGLRQSASLAPATLTLALTRALASVATAAVTWSLIGTFLTGQTAITLPVAGGLSVLWLMAQLLGGVLLAGALHQGRQRLLGDEVPSLLTASLKEAQRGLAYPLWLAVLQVFQDLWRWTALGAGFVLYARALGGAGSGFLASLSLALGLTLSLLLGMGLLVWLRLGLVQAVHARQGIAAGLAEAVGLLRRTFGVPLLVVLLFGLFASMAEGMVTTLVTPLGRAPDASPAVLLQLASISGMVAALMGALPAIFFEHAGWQGLMAWRLGQDGLLPPEWVERPRVSRGLVPALAGAQNTGLARGEVILDASPLSPQRHREPGSGAVIEAMPLRASPSADGGPVVEATPLGSPPSADGGPVVEATPLESATSVDGGPVREATSPRDGASTPQAPAAANQAPEREALAGEDAEDARSLDDPEGTSGPTRSGE